MALTKLPKNAFGTGSVDDTKIEDGTIQNQEISGTIPADKLASTQDLSSKTVTLPDTSVTSDQLAGTIENAKLSNSSFTVRGTSRSLGDSFNLGINVEWQAVVTGAGSSSTAVAGNGYFIDTTSNTHTLNLPASASLGDQIAIKDYAGTFASNNLTIGRNGHNIQGVANDSLISTNRASLVLVYVDSTKGWLYTDEHNLSDLQAATFITATGGTVSTSGDYKIHTFTGDGTFVVCSTANPLGGPNNVDYLVVAGGGGGGGKGQEDVQGAGGGGAGGHRTGFPSPGGTTPVSATTYPITVGGGGAGGPNTPGPSGSPSREGSNGSNSVFSTITSTGGGGGGNSGGATPGGFPGGSGGGGGPTNGSGNTPPVSPPQGNNGGTRGGTNRGGGGGGASAVGTNGSTPIAGPGGDGTANSINGSSVTRAGGGGGGGYCTPGSPTAPGGAGGSGGGGAGALDANATSGTANTGGGGGGVGGPSTGTAYSGGSGGKGIVIIRYKYQ